LKQEVTSFFLLKYHALTQDLELKGGSEGGGRGRQDSGGG